MQHKSLLAALMVGVLALASCVKNEESQSVTDMRNARADEIKSQAELNRANAQAAITLAQAQATIAAAQAELLEAQAAIAAAQAAKVMVEAELQAVEVEIAKVKLEEEKVKLQAKKAELEALKAKYEAEIAKYQADKQEALNRLAKAEMQAEIDEIDMQKKLLAEEEALLKAIKGVEAEKQTQITYLWGKYAQEVTDLSTAQKELIKATAQLAILEAGEDTAADIVLEQLYDLRSLIIAKQMYIETLKENISLTKPELDAMMNVVNAELSEAYSEQLQAQEAANVLSQQLEALEQKEFTYEQGWDSADGFIAWFTSLPEFNGGNIFTYAEYDEYGYPVTTVNLFSVEEEENEVTGQTEVGVYFFYEAANNTVKTNTFIPLYTKQPTWVKVNDGTPVVYPESVDGLVPAYTIPVQEKAYYPAKLYFENIEAVIDIIATIKQENNKTRYNSLLSHANLDAEYLQKMTDLIAEEITAQKAYVEEALPEITAAYSAYLEASSAYQEANINYGIAYDKYNHYVYLNQSTVAAQEEAIALTQLNDAVEAKEAAEKVVEEAYEILYGKTPENLSAEGDGEGEGATEGLIAKVARLENASFEAGKVVAEKEAALAEPKKAWVEKQEELVTAVADAEKAIADQEKEILKAQDAEDAALEAYHKAVIIYTADPKGEGNEQAMKDAEKAWKDAQKKVTDEQGKLPDLEKDLADAQAEYDKVFNPYDEAKKAYDDAKEIADELKKEWEKAKAELGTRVDPADGTAYKKYYVAQANLEEAILNVKAKEDNLKAKQEANPDDTEELNQLRVAYWTDAYNVRDELSKKATEAKKEYLAVTNGEDAKYPEFWNNYYHITPGYGYMFPEIREFGLGSFTYYAPYNVYAPGQNLGRYLWYLEQFDVLEAYYEKALDNTNYAVLNKKLEDIVAVLAKYEEAEEDYFAIIAEMQYLSDTINAADMAVVDAKNVVAKLKASKAALDAFKGTEMYSTDGTNQLTIADYEKKIADEEQDLIKLEEQYAALVNEFYFGKFDGTDYVAGKIVELENKIEKLQTEIEYHAAMIDYYLGLLSELLDIEPTYSDVE